jgi:signal transduction histidine kinase
MAVHNTRRASLVLDVNPMVDWFLPPNMARGRTESEMARTFVFTHLFGPVIAQPMPVYIYLESPAISAPLIAMTVAIWSFWALPFVLRWTGNFKLASWLSFQMLAISSLLGTYLYGGFSSPFLPWLIVSLMLGLFYLSKSARAVLLVFALNMAAFTLVILALGFPNHIPVDRLNILGWLSIGAATIYMAWMALYYARIIGLRSELGREIERQRATALDLQRARAIAERGGQARARFFAKMSHELRTPLNAIIGYSDLLLEDHSDGAGPDAEARAKAILRINAAGRHLLSLVSDVLDSGQLDNDLVAVEVSEFSLGDLCDEVVATALPAVTANRNRFEVVCADREHRLRTDVIKLRQILLNLLGNAGKFTTEGVVKLELRLDLRSNDHQLSAIVSDTGIGIDPEVLPRLFTDYEQADTSTFARFGGTGLGLALSRKLSVLLNGEIIVSSSLGHGSTFTVNVPTHLRATGRSGSSGHVKRTDADAQKVGGGGGDAPRVGSITHKLASAQQVLA